MDTVGLGGNRNVCAGVDEQPSNWGVSAQDLNQFAGETDEGGGAQVLFAELYEVDTGRGKALGLLQQGGFARKFVSGEADSVRDGVTEHN
jgi:hypothetical protein